MEWIDFQYYGILGAAIAVGTLTVTVQKIFKNLRKEREEHSAKILTEARESDAVLKAKLEARIEKIDAQLKNLELNINKDIGYLKSSYTTEIKALGEKIEVLRTELSSQHGALLSLLTDLVKKKKN